MRVRAILIAVGILFAADLHRPLQAQDAHYWNNQYGTRARLLGGLVVGSFADLSVTYYNPSALVGATSQQFDLGSDALEFISIQAADRTGTNLGLDLGSTRSRTVPSMVAYGLPPLGKHRVAVSVLTRFDFELDVDANIITSPDKLVSGDVDVVSDELVTGTDLSEHWYGITWAYPLAPTVSIGATTYLAYRSRVTRTEVTAFSVSPEGQGSAFKGANEARYSGFRALWKLGAAIDLSPLTVGVTVTTPSVVLTGSGRTFYERSRTNFTLPGDDVPSTELEANLQDGVAASYKSPLAIAAGARYQIASTGLYVSGEWFDRLDEYTLLEAEDFVGQTTGDTISVRLTQRQRSVFNWGLGLDHELAEKLHLFGAFTTDRSFIEDPQDVANQATATWDIFHLSVGVEFAIGGAAITFGVAQSFGNEQDRDVHARPGATADFTYRSTRLLFGFSTGG